jgi:phage terminase large subunit
MPDVELDLPHNWEPRPHQIPLWTYLENGGLRAVEVAHRRWGKDDVALHWTAVAAQQKIGTYWHMLPQASQARKAIWNAVNPHSGLRRIDEAFPEEIRDKTLENEMFIRFKCGSTWQVVGSDNYNSLIGSPPRGVVFSEYSVANPTSWGILRPILLENGGWALFIYTPRGDNHGKTLLKSAQGRAPRWFAQVSKISETKLLTQAQLDEERSELISEFGEDAGSALFDQEWECSFDAALLGAFYGLALRKLEQRGGVREVHYQPELPTYTAWDLGRTDDTSIWWYQMVRGEIHVVDFYSASGEDPDSIAKVVIERPARIFLDGQVIRDKRYHYAKHYLPHDARAKTFAAHGKSAIEQLGVHLGIGNLEIVPSLSVQDGIQAVREALPRVYFDAENCEVGINALKTYQREYDDERKVFRPTPLHNWASNPADAFRMLAIASGNEPRIIRPDPSKPLIVGVGNQSTLNDAWAAQRVSTGRRI